MLDNVRQKDTLIVSISGELDHYAAPKIRAELDEVLQDKSIRKLCLDLKAMSFMDSSGIGVLMGRYKLLNRRGGEIYVKNMNSHVRRIFDMSGLRQIVGVQE
ncbi:MAG: anti-sigma F factor antagonist [Eubacteriales bacterium]|nr:anti-sigma F factor antagonist [Eubacteriales bacterium]MDD3882059.1 anti-sigma F factor antagonist [Eubacteriales bacterium]MDD4512506.1 anti-sigma F factor antagonist [Eubacteriales bacterium]